MITRVGKPYTVEKQKMGVFNTHKSREFVSVDNKIIGNPKISAKAKIVLIYLLSKPSGWKIYESDIVAHMRESRFAVRAAIKELTVLGYIKKGKKRVKKNGRFDGYQYDVFDVPAGKPKIVRSAKKATQTEQPAKTSHKPGTDEYEIWALEQRLKKRSAPFSEAHGLTYDQIMATYALAEAANAKNSKAHKNSVNLNTRTKPLDQADIDMLDAMGL